MRGEGGGWRGADGWRGYTMHSEKSLEVLMVIDRRMKSVLPKLLRGLEL